MLQLTHKMIGVTAAIVLSTSSAMAATTQGAFLAGWSGQGGFGLGTPDGDVTTLPENHSAYAYVTTNGGLDGVGALPGVSGTEGLTPTGTAAAPNDPLGPGGTPQTGPSTGSTLTSNLLSAQAGDVVEFFFNYVTSDGAGYADYAWARLLNDQDDQVALLYTARTVVNGSVVPGLAMPTPEATLSPGSVTITPNASQWSALGSDSGECFEAGCGSTGWVKSSFEIANAGDYRLQFGVTNWTDSSYHSGMAVAGTSINGIAIQPSAVPLPAAGWLMLAGLGGLAAMRRKEMRAKS